MKKVVLFGFLVIVAAVVFAGTEYRDQCRRILYAVDPVEAISKIDNVTLRTLSGFAFGTVQGQDRLNATDAVLFDYLSEMELARREKTPDEFSLFLQEKRESLASGIKKFDSRAIKIDGWIDLFQLNLILNN